MPVSSRYFVIFLCATLPAHAQSTTKKPAAKTVPAKSTTARASQGEVSPLPAPDVEFASPVIVPARATATAQIAPATSAVEGDLAQFLSGKLVPLDMKLSEMKIGWQSLRVVRADEKNAEEAPRSLPDDFWKQIEERFGSMNNRYFTQGRTLRINNDVHLIVYRSQLPSMEVAGNWLEAHFDRKTNPRPQFDDMLQLWKQFLDTVPVRASLINTRNISAMEDVATFDFSTQFAKIASEQKTEYNRLEAARQKQIAVAKSDPAIENNFKHLFDGVIQYGQDYEEKLPPLQDLAATRKAIEPYVNKSAWMDDINMKLHPNALLSKKPMAHLKPYASSMILFYSDDDAKGERWVLRLDGQVRRVNAAQWPQLKIAARIP